MFAAGVRLRYTHPEVPRRYRVPFGNVGIWALFIIGTLAGLVAIVFAFIPPETVAAADRPAFITIVAIGFISFTLLPLLIFQLRKPKWKGSS